MGVTVTIIALLAGHRLLVAAGTAPFTALDTAILENFNSLASTGTSSVTPSGWTFVESGSNGNTLYNTSTGSNNAGDTYSFGAASSAERAFGTLRSGTNVPTIGASFVNDTGQLVGGVSIAYTGEQWRVGTINRGPDRLDFQYSTDAVSLTTGTWTDVNALDFSSPNTAAVGLLDGNLAANRASLSATIGNLSIPDGGTLWIRWLDVDVSGADDGLAIDDFSITPRPPTPTDPVAAGSALPSTLTAGDAALLRVTVTPGGFPPSTGLNARVDLSAIGGSSSQLFADDGSNGDAVAGDNIFTFFATTSDASSGVFNLPIVVEDAQGRTSPPASIQLTVNAFVPLTPIPEIQGTGSTSPMVGAYVRTSGVVTAVKAGSGFFLQSPAGDGNAQTSDALFVFTAGTPFVIAGQDVRVTGFVQEFVPAGDPGYPPITEIASNPIVSLASLALQALPPAVTITAAMTYPPQAYDDLEGVEAMRVHIADLLVVAPTDGDTNEASATSTSNGDFFGVIAGVPRPFREPGIELPGPVPPGTPANVPRFDGNAERLRVDTDRQPGGLRLDVSSGSHVLDVVGVLDYSFRAYTILTDPAPSLVVVPGPAARPVREIVDGEFTVASFNMERFFDTTNDAGISDVALTPTAFANRLNKASLAIRGMMRMPDIIGVEEVENLATLCEVAKKINADEVDAGRPDPGYVARLEEGNDIGGIDVGFLIKSSRGTQRCPVTQIGKDATYIDPDGNPALLNDRPSLVLRASVGLPAGPFPVTIVVNHLRSLSGVDDPDDGPRVRAKRRAQAEMIAAWVQGEQTANPAERIVLVGDFNAFQFNDGFVDSIGTIKGSPAPADQVVLASADLVDPNLVDLGDLVPADQQYSFVFGGNAQELDHILVTESMKPWVGELQYARSNADFPEALRSDPSRPERLSDHDMAVAYFGDLTPPVITATASTSFLWPANHKMVDVVISVQATDAAGPVTTIAIASVTSNEPEDGLGDGDTGPDWVITGPTSVRLRAERSGTGDGRIYTIVIEAVDAAGNRGSTSVLITVPKSASR